MGDWAKKGCDVDTRTLVLQFLSCFVCAEEENCRRKYEGDCRIVRIKQLRNRETVKLSIPVLMSQPKVSKTAVFEKGIPRQIFGSSLSTSYPGRQEQKYNILVSLQNC